MKTTKTMLFRELKEYFMIAFGLLLYALSWNFFFFPHEVAGGGATGIATIVMYGTQGLLSEGMSSFFGSLGMVSIGGGFPVSATFFILNSVLLVLSVKILGWKFSIRSIYGVLCLTMWLWIPFKDIYNSMFTAFPIFDPFMSTIIGGIISGIGMGLVFINFGSSGGTDILAKIVNKYRSISLGKALLICDIVVITSAILLPYGSLEKVIYGYIVTFVMTNTIDVVINGVRQSVQFFIFSKEYEQISDVVQHELNRGVTVIDGQGWYSKQPVKIITIMCRKNESNRVFKIVKDIDKNAFISQSAAIGVYGQGFDPIGQK